MADHFTMFSTHIPYASPDQRQWLLDALKTAEDEQDGQMCHYDDQPNESSVWAYAEEQKSNGWQTSSPIP